MSAPKTPKILLVDDDADVRSAAARGLRLSGFDVATAVDGRDALAQLNTYVPDAVVLDIEMPRLDGVAVVTALRALGNDIPICVLSARDSVNDRIAGLEAGADDYLTKPFDLGELAARIRALLRRSAVGSAANSAGAVGDKGRGDDGSASIVTVGDVTIDPPRRLVYVGGVRTELTKKEFDLLAVLAENVGVVVSRSRLMELVWGYDFEADTNVIDVFASYLRRKLEAGGAARVVHTVRGIGFVLRVEP